jgi:hypothetical protein
MTMSIIAVGVYIYESAQAGKRWRTKLRMKLCYESWFWLVQCLVVDVNAG